MFVCGISGKVPSHPVVTRSSGVLYEKSLIEAYIDLHHRCPVTGEELEKDGLLPLYTHPSSGVQESTLRSCVTTLPMSACGGGWMEKEGEIQGVHVVPSLVDRLQSEWKSMQLEQFALRQQLAQTKQELAHALQKNEAACRVVARLHQTCDTLRSQVKEKRGEGEGKHTSSSPCRTEHAAVVLPLAVVHVIDAQAEHYRARRRQPLATLLGLPPLPPAERFASLSLDGLVVGGGVEKRGGRTGSTAWESAAKGGPPYTCASLLYGARREGVAPPYPAWIGLGTATGHIDLLHRETGMVFPLAGVGHTDVVHTLTTFFLSKDRETKKVEEEEQATGTSAAASSPSSLLISASLDKTVKVWKVVGDTNAISAALEATTHEEPLHLDGPASKRSKTEAVSTAPTDPPSDEETKEEGKHGKGRPHLHCLETLHYAHGVSAVAPTLAAGRYLLAAGDSRHGTGPYLYFSDLFPEEMGRESVEVEAVEENNRVGAQHLTVVNVGASGPASSAPFSHLYDGSDSASRWGVIHSLALHPYGTFAGLLFHASSTYWPVMTWDPPSTTSVGPRRGGGGEKEGGNVPLSSVLVIWDVKKMVCDTMLPITTALWKRTPASRAYEEAHGPSFSAPAEVGVLGTSVDFAADTLHVAVGLSDGGVLVWDLRRLSQLLAYIPPPPPSKVWFTSGGSGRAEKKGLRGGPLPAVVRFFTNWVGCTAEESKDGSKTTTASSSPATTCLAVAVGGVLSIYAVRELKAEAARQPCVKEIFLSPASTNPPFISRSMTSWSSPGDRGSIFAVSSYNHTGVAVCSTEE